MAITICSLAICLVAIVGCSQDPLKKVRVHGTVTFDGEACPGPGRITFSPLEVAEGLVKRPASGAFDTEGTYQAMSFRPDDGLVPGRYRVGIACYDASKLSGAPGDAEFVNASLVGDSFVPQELIVEVGSKKIEYNLDVPRKK